MPDDATNNPAPDAGNDFPDVDATAAEFDALAARVKQLEDELAAEKSRVLRVMADFQNSQRRNQIDLRNAKLDGVVGGVHGIIPLIDHFDLALAQDPKSASAEQIIAGVKVIREEFIRVLARLGASIIAPAKGDEFTPGRHEAIMQMPDAGVSPGCIVMTMQPGFAMAHDGGERIIRAAKVAVAPNANA